MVKMKRLHRAPHDFSKNEAKSTRLSTLFEQSKNGFVVILMDRKCQIYR